MLGPWDGRAHGAGIWHPGGVRLGDGSGSCHLRPGRDLRPLVARAIRAADPRPCARCDGTLPTRRRCDPFRPSASVLPFAPAQTVDHYLSHVILGITQIPIVVIPLKLRRLEGPVDRSKGREPTQG